VPVRRTYRQRKFFVDELEMTMPPLHRPNAISCLRLLAAALLLWGTLAGQALAEGRPFPPETLRGKMTPGYYPELQIDGKPRRLAAGARIFNEDNLITVPAALRGSDIVVNYTVNGAGEIERVWILSAPEAAQSLAQQTGASS
jgi:hypothetical protein